jgi:hypothetical protein
MIRQSQSNALLAYCERKVESIKREIEDAEAVHDEAPHRTEYTDFLHTDFIHDLNTKLTRWELIKEDAEMIETMPDSVPTFTSRVVARAVPVICMFLGAVVGVELAVAVIYQDKELAWSNAKNFWSQVWRLM